MIGMRKCLSCPSLVSGKNKRYCDECGPIRIRARRVVDVTKRRRKLKHLAVEYKGNKCNLCGYTKCADALEFHHLDPKEKDFGLSSGGVTRSWNKIKLELDKCILVCANCHREIHAGLHPDYSPHER